GIGYNSTGSGAQNDSYSNPTDLGSGGGGSSCGGVGAAGGGAAILNVGGSLTVNGTITANGNNPSAGGCHGNGAGAGGTINITTLNLFGSGTLQANGGTASVSPDNGGGGGGGRIAVTVTGTDTSTLNMTAGAGLSGASFTGGAGTIYVRGPTQTTSFNLLISGSTVAARTTLISGGNLTIDTFQSMNSIVAFANGSFVTFTSSVSIGGQNTITLTTAAFNAPVAFYGNNAISWTSAAFNAGMTIPNGSTNTITYGAWNLAPQNLTLPYKTTVIQNSVFTTSILGDVTMQSGSVWMHTANTTSRSFIVNLNVSGNLDVQSGATIALNGKGYQGNSSAAGSGPGGSG